jgi:hypothetical protein
MPILSGVMLMKFENVVRDPYIIVLIKLILIPKPLYKIKPVRIELM